MEQFWNNIGGFRFGPDDPPAGGSPAPTPAVASPAATPTPSPSPAAAAATTTPPAASASLATGVGTTTSTPAAPAASWLDGFRQAGVFGADVNEDAARQRLIQDSRDAAQLRQLAPLATEYQRHQGEFQEFLNRRKEEQAKQQANDDWTKKLGWNPPEFDPNWVSMLTRDDKGNVTAIPGAPADIALKYQRYEQWRRAEVDKLIANPFKYMEPAIRHLAGEMAQQTAQQSVGSYREQVEAQGFIQKHSDWLFAQDASGQPKSESRFNPETGRHDSQKVLSDKGKMFVERLRDYAQQGLNPEQQQKFAFNDVRIAYMSSPEYQDYLLAERAKTTAAAGVASPAGAAATETARQAANAAFLSKSNPANPPAPSAGGNTVPAPQAVTRHNIQDIMLKRMREQGVTIP